MQKQTIKRYLEQQTNLALQYIIKQVFYSKSTKSTEVQKYLKDFCQENTLVIANPSFNNVRDISIHGHHQMVNNKIRLIIFFVTEDGETLYSQDKEDLGLTIISFLLQNSGLSQSRENH